MQDILIEYAVSIVVSVVVALIGYAGSWVLSKLAKKIELSNISAATKTLIEMTQQTVKELQQTVVDDLKADSEDGKLTDAEIRMLGEKLLEITESKLSDSIKGLLTAAKVDIESLIKSAAESYIHELKRGW
jgi:ferritin-like metal-binding protein YciE